jgi:ribosomal protein S6E (S10)
MRSMLGAITFTAAVVAAFAGAQAFDDSKYPNWKGMWDRGGIPPRWTPPGQTAPLTPEYKVLFDQNTADQKAGGHGMEPSWRCLPPGMPRIMNVYEPMEIIITPATTYIVISHIQDNRRIYTDGRDWPKEIDPTFRGQSIGKWLDTDGDGIYDTLEVETRHLKGPRTFDSTGIPMHADNKTIVKERIFLDKTKPDQLRNEITTIDNALTRPWTVTKVYRRTQSNGPIWWRESICAENNSLIRIGKEVYYNSADGLLMPAKKDQAPPDLRYFKPAGR